ncbi:MULTISPECIES: hypothetical protein [Spongiibacter]|uniref:hypothetical protein n=1 Tax=Spongiibacter TaxID=630749 RepID=UPI000C4316D3|nr:MULTISPECIES: hypothetical protein [Spongiibacter]MAY38999.1 hypothetical protein [Spongiibacter sp.]MBI56885.1 hypothetical protein [Spongiibacter sp.]MBO6753907.1 hypothetical protein [Spongiibacter sp.]|tara:strand:- start:24117 stop:25274 length:1158 start_codon:yes stop_codon:yes gene_type:complete
MNSLTHSLRQGKTLRKLALCTALFGAGATHAGIKVDIGDDSYLTLGAGLRAAATFTEDAAPSGDAYGKDFDIQNIRIYLGGQLNKTIGFTLNTDEIFGDGPVDVLDAIARFEFSPGVNVWIGRMLTPADRIEMNGPFYGLTWNQYTQPLYPSDQGGMAGTYGRDDGVTFWGAQGKFQYALGVFDGLQGASNVDDELLFAGRFAYNFLNMEANPGYYTSGTYYGSLGNILTLAASFQSQSGGSGSATESGDFSGYTIDLLSETVLDGGGVVTVDAEYKSFEADYTVATPTAVPADCFCLFDGESAYVTVAYLIPGGETGRFQPYLRHVSNEPSDADSSELTELGVNYIIDGHNARLNLNYNSGDANISGYAGPDRDSLSFGVQLQL